jgi:hypothetical protein
MTHQDIRDKILDLHRSIFLEPPAGQTGYRHQFLATHAVIEMWETDATRHLTWELAKETTSTRPKLAHGDRESYAKLLVEVIKQRLFNPAFYSFPFPPRGSLFAHISNPDLNAFADSLWTEFLSAAEAAVRTWLTIHPLPKVKLSVPTQTFGNVKIIAANDAAAWQTLARSFPVITSFNPLLGFFQSDGGGYAFNTTANVWLVAEHAGTVDAARQRATREMSVLIALMFATAKKPGHFLKSGADPVNRVLQISDVAVDGTSTVQFGSIVELLPPLLNELHFDAAILTDVEAWFRKRASTASKAGRASVAASFYHHGLMADDLERFVHLFVVMDALFGIPYQVGQKINEGALAVFSGDTAWEDRATKLYNLRNAIVHGDISALQDWAGRDAYYSLFKAKPENEVITLATTSLLRFFDIP